MFTTGGVLLLLLVLGRTQDFENKVADVTVGESSRLLKSKIRRNLATNVCSDKVINLENEEKYRERKIKWFSTKDSGHEYTPTCAFSTEPANEQIFRHVVRPGTTFRIRQQYNRFDSFHELSVGTSCENAEVIVCRDDPDTMWEQYSNRGSEDVYAFFVVDGYNSGNKGSFYVEWETIDTPIPGEWQVGEYDSCSSTCGESYRRRKVICYDNKCLKSEKPEEIEKCETEPCPIDYETMEKKMIELKGRSSRDFTSEYDNRNSGNDYTPTCTEQSGNEQIFSMLLKPGQEILIRQRQNTFDSVQELYVGTSFETSKQIACHHYDFSWMEYINRSDQDVYAFFIVDAYAGRGMVGRGRIALEWNVEFFNGHNYKEHMRKNKLGGDIGTCTAYTYNRWTWPVPTEASKACDAEARCIGFTLDNNNKCFTLKSKEAGSMVDSSNHHYLHAFNWRTDGW